jgi:predicted nucleic acid-binding protein
VASDWAVDSSVGAKWVLTEPDTPLAVRMADDVRAAGGRVIILDLARIEIANAIRNSYHRGLLSLAEAETAFIELTGISADVREAAPLLSAAFSLATRYGLAVYDALFVALTVALGIPGVTADEPLYRAVHADHPQIHLLRNWPPPAPPAATPP